MLVRHVRRPNSLLSGCSNSYNRHSVTARAWFSFGCGHAAANGRLLSADSCSKPRSLIQQHQLSDPAHRWCCSKSKSSPMPGNKWWNADTVAVVTGANKGIGFEVARLLAEAGMAVVVTSRSGELGQAAVKKLSDLPSTQGSKLEYHQLDISQPDSVAAFASWLKKQHGKLDILVNNAGIAYKGHTFGAEEAQTTLATNFGGTKAVCEAVLPLMSKGARIVNVSSTSGALSNIPSASLRAKLDAPDSVNDLVQLGDKFVDDIRVGRHAQEGWSNSMYGISKALETSYTRVLAKQLQDKGIMVNACCPGYCSTDMSSWRGTQSAAAGADTPVWLALLPPDDFKTGGFWRDRQQRDF